MVDHVLVPVDDSAQSMDALEFACTEYADTTITALHVLDPGDFYGATGIEGGAMANYEEIQKHHENRAEELLEQARKRAADHDVELETDHVIGGISRSIVDYADEHDVDLIAIGSHGRTGASRILLGSVAEKVARRSPVPVTIVR
ncbi:universal stress protein [Natronorubrum thiooxidans]|uniref:Nucleotide-binding universal stress protein, UspA family n=1 Tax=Natronorubrum thiooxidans TaxID=308853 RepID=A0A1N7C3Z8_9EURY|nr:universal stress protein [Natronorubrum thiooxidans]SIR58287.1 Nucleotide-binding universal stress protein, UspA family [Natronorubrum thiooxidans]